MGKLVNQTPRPAREPFLGHAKVETFLRKRNRLREAIRREGTPAIQDAWDAFEGFTDCIDPAATLETQGKQP